MIPFWPDPSWYGAYWYGPRRRRLRRLAARVLVPLRRAVWRRPVPALRSLIERHAR
ncbi:MAG TPA: hypothetical protein VMU85_18490 [Stellaceae bacterium]|nr:hypothetical protein [Stellaceae bacterium]